MIVGIHQPNYLPYLGFFDKMKKSDIFVIYDDAQFVKSDFQHRNKIKIYHGWKWLTVPVCKKRIPISDIKIKNDVQWKEQHLGLIKDNYSNTKYFNKFWGGLEHIYQNDYESLLDLNVDLIHFLKKSFSINTEIIFASDLAISGSSTNKIINIVKSVSGDIYLSGPSGVNYLDSSLFAKNDIKLILQDFKCPTYKQKYGDFIPNLSAIDALFNVGNVL